VKAGAGIYFGPDDPRNQAIRIPQMLGPSNQVGEVVAIKARGSTTERAVEDLQTQNRQKTDSPKTLRNGRMNASTP
jgi:hypothetical protein